LTLAENNATLLIWGENERFAEMKINQFKTVFASSLALGASLLATPALAQMSFKAIPLADPATCGNRCPTVIQAEGRIGLTTAADFVNFAKATSDRSQLLNIVLINSPGGSVIGSMRLGVVFRTLGATVVVARINQGGGFLGGGQTDSRTGKTIPVGAITNANCNSACVYAVMGGRKRVIPEQSNIGIHRMQAEINHGFDPVKGTQVFEKKSGTTTQVDLLRRYAKSMGINQKLIEIAESVPHETIKILSAAEVRQFKLGASKL
jgi:hypothetical protein